MLTVIVAAYGVGAAFFTPAFESIVPSIVDPDDLAQANALDQFVRPIALRLIGPALGGWLIALVGVGTAFAIDAVSFIVSGLMVLGLRRVVAGTPAPASTVAALRDGWRFVRANVWLWGTLLSAAIAYLAFLGPTETLVPFIVKNVLHGSATDLGLRVRRRWNRRRRRRGRRRATWPAEARRHVHVRLLDDRDARRRRATGSPRRSRS